MIFVGPNYLLIGGVVLFGLVLLAATLATRKLQPRPLLRKSTWLLAAGIALAWINGGRTFCLLLLAAAAVTLSAGRGIASARRRSSNPAANGWLSIGLAANLGAVAAMKALAQVVAPHASRNVMLLLPVGISFVAFHGVSFLVDVHQRRVHAHSDASQIGVYLVLLPQFVAGPLRFRDAAAQLARRSVDMSDFAYGARRLAIGIGKRALIAAPCAEVANELFRLPVSDLTASAAWLALVSFTIEVYFTFSAYADMAIGVGRLFGLKLEENFRWPYEGTSIAEFWQRWHMGLTSWFREYVSTPLRVRTNTRAARWAEPLVILLCAGWYGLTWGWIAWGVYHALFYALEHAKVIDSRRFPAALRHLYLVAVVVIGWVFVRTASLTDALLFFKALAGLNASARVHRLPVSLGVWSVLLAGAIGSAPLARALRRWSVAIDGATTSAVMMLFATIVFVWRGLLLLLPHNHAVPTRRAS